MGSPRLDLTSAKDPVEFFDPEAMTLDDFIAASSHVFIALHGGDGEDGTLQGRLHASGVKFNGPSESVSRLCMDKFATARFIDDLRLSSVRAITSEVLPTDQLLRASSRELGLLWRGLRRRLDAKTLIVKPRADGCSTGIAHLFSPDDLRAYVAVLRTCSPIPKNTLRAQAQIIEMPPTTPAELLFERFITTDTLVVRDKSLTHKRRSGWLEVTIGVLQDGVAIRALNPSITNAEGEVLSVEEKFQGGTGINITPPPSSIIAPRVLRRVRTQIARLASLVGIEGYSRIDAFVRACRQWESADYRDKHLAGANAKHCVLPASAR